MPQIYTKELLILCNAGKHVCEPPDFGALKRRYNPLSTVQVGAELVIKYRVRFSLARVTLS